MSFVSDVRGPQPDAFAFRAKRRKTSKTQERERGLPPSDWHELFRPNLLIKTLISSPNL